MPPKSESSPTQCECKTVEGKLCWNTGSHNVGGRWVCGTHVKSCKGGYASSEELSASRTEFVGKREAKSERARGLGEFKSLPGQSSESRVFRTVGKVKPETSRKSMGKIQSDDRSRVVEQQQKERKTIQQFRERLRPGK